MSRDSRSERTRQLVAMEAARIMFDEQVDDVNNARRKAADRLGVSQRNALPNNKEIDEAYRAHVALFARPDQADKLRELRRVAVQAMEFLVKFNPKLVGPVLEGTANPHSAVELHVLAHTAEEISLFLVDKKIPYQEGEVKLHVGGGKHFAFPTFSFVAQNTPIEITVFSHDGMRNAPSTGLDSQTIRRANLAAVKALIG